MVNAPDWEALRVLLRDESRRVLQAFQKKHGKDDLTGVGYVFALWNVTPQLDLCANTSEPSDDEEERFNSGDYEFPAGLTGKARELGAAWWKALSALHALAAKEGDNDKKKSAVYRGLVTLVGTVLLDLRAEGFFPDEVDFNVSEAGDDSEIVAKRHKMLKAWKVPDAGKKWSKPKI